MNRQSNSSVPTPLELLILKVLWAGRPRTVRQVRDALAADPQSPRDLALTSVTTVLNIMVRKKQVTRRKPADGGVYCYEACIPPEETARSAMKSIVDAAFSGSAGAAVLNLVQTADLDSEELRSLRALINEKLKKRHE